jgi:hypothetical protein
MAKDTNAIAQIPASIALTGVEGNGITLKLDAGTLAGKLSTSGKTMVLASDKVKYNRADGAEVVVQITMYTPIAK